jgi:hypothetical protein
MDDRKPTSGQILAAKVRAARESFIKKHRKPLAGGYEIPPTAEIYDSLAEEFPAIPRQNFSFFFTYSRTCTHTWAEGVCSKCPVPVMYEDYK